MTRTVTQERRHGSRTRAPHNFPMLIAWVLGLAQLMILLVEEEALVSRGDLTLDYQIFGRAFWQIGHGIFMPTVYVASGGGDVPYIANHFELITWPLALLFVGILRLPVHVVLLDLLQAAPTAMVTPLVACWASLAASRRQLTGSAQWVVVLCPAVLSFIDVWNYRAASFDFHYQALQGALSLLALVFFERKQPRIAWAALIALALTGDPAGLVIAVLGCYFLVRKHWRRGLIINGIAAVTVLLPSLLRDNLGSFTVLPEYAQIASSHSTAIGPIILGLATHPHSVGNQIFAHILDIWGLVSGAGVLGITSLPGLLSALFIGFPSWLASLPFSYPGDFQTEPITCFLLLGSGTVLAQLALKHRRLFLFTSSTSLILACGWSIVFAPGLVSGIESVSNSTVGKSLAMLARIIPKDAVLYTPNASMGIVGQRTYRVFPAGCPPFNVALDGHPIAVVADPWRGIQTCAPAQLLSTLSGVAALPGAKTIELPGGVFWTEWQPPAGQKSLSVPASYPITAKILASEPFKVGSYMEFASGGVVTSPPRGGFVIEGITGEIDPGAEGVAEVTLSVSGRADVQVFDDATGQMVGERHLIGAGQIVAQKIRFAAPAFKPPSNFTDGIGIFRTELVPPILFDPMEVRVWVPPGTGSSAAVVSAWVGPAKQAPGG